MWKAIQKQQQNGASPKVRTLGLTSPISLAEPKPEDHIQTAKLQNALKPNDVFETDSELNHRNEILAKLSTLAKEWMKKICIHQKNVSPALAEKLGGRIYTFGSYRLGAHHRGADIDALCVAPCYIDRADFFKSFMELLKKQPKVTQCRAVEEAFVPVIMMNFDGIEIDLLFARLNFKQIPVDLDLSDDSILKNLDQRCVRSLNGSRVTDEILRLVPNVENFRQTLQAVKLWAKKQGVYSNSLGYFGGVSWAMLVARTCQLYPNAVASTLVHKFFLIFSHWKWPLPVLLKKIDNGNLDFHQVWDPRINVADRHHLMPIITPSYPQQNSTFNVARSNETVMVRELKRGLAITEEILSGHSTWERLFEAPNFFMRYKHFIVLVAKANTPKDHLEWCGLVESKIRLLISNLERNTQIALAHINPKCYAKSPLQSMWFIGLEFEKTDNMNIDVTEDIKTFNDAILKHAKKILKWGMAIDARHLRRKELKEYLDEDIVNCDRKKKSMVMPLVAIGSKRRPSEHENQTEKKIKLSESNETN